MKKFTVKITLVMELPDDFELVEVPHDGHEAFKRGSEYYYPSEHWTRRGHHMLFGPETAPGVMWESVDDDTANDFNNYCTYNGIEIEPGDTA